MPTRPDATVKVADEVWIAAATLHREHPERPDFLVDEIVARASRLGLTARRPNPGRYRMLFESAPGRRRLFRKGDPYSPDREGGKITPNREDLPPPYTGLLSWYGDWGHSAEFDP